MLERDAKVLVRYATGFPTSASTVVQISPVSARNEKQTSMTADRYMNVFAAGPIITVVGNHSRFRGMLAK